MSIDPAQFREPGETSLGRWPDLGGRVLLEHLVIAVQCLSVPVTEFFSFRRTSGGGIVVQWLLQYGFAEMIPVGSAVCQVQVPRLIDILAGCHRVIAVDGEDAESQVFCDDSVGILDRPAVVPCQSIGEGE